MCMSHFVSMPSLLLVCVCELCDKTGDTSMFSLLVTPADDVVDASAG